MEGTPPETDIEETPGGTEEGTVPGGPKRNLVENIKVLPAGVNGGDGGGSSIGNEGGGGWSDLEVPQGCGGGTGN